VLTAGGGVGFLASAPGGCILASTDAVTLLLLPLTGAVEATLTGQTGGVRAACVLSDGSNRVLTGSGSEHAVVCLHDLSVARVGIRSVARGGIRSVARGGIKPVARGGIRLSPRRTFIGRDSVPRVAMCGLGAGTVRDIVELSGGRFAGACYNGIFVWAMHSGVRLTTLSGHTGAVHALAAADDHTLVSSGYDKTLRLWDTRSYTCVASVPAPSIVLALLRLTDGTVASGHDDGVVRLWYTRRRKIVGELRGHTARVSGLARLPGGRLASVSTDGTVRLWVAAARACVGLVVTAPSTPKCCCVTAVGGLAVSCGDGSVLVLDFPWTRRSAAVVGWVVAHS